MSQPRTLTLLRTTGPRAGERTEFDYEHAQRMLALQAETGVRGWQVEPTGVADGQIGLLPEVDPSCYPPGAVPLTLLTTSATPPTDQPTSPDEAHPATGRSKTRQARSKRRP